MMEDRTREKVGGLANAQKPRFERSDEEIVEIEKMEVE